MLHLLSLFGTDDESGRNIVDKGQMVGDDLFSNSADIHDISDFEEDLDDLEPSEVLEHLVPQIQLIYCVVECKIAGLFQHAHGFCPGAAVFETLPKKHFQSTQKTKTRL